MAKGRVANGRGGKSPGWQKAGGKRPGGKGPGGKRPGGKNPPIRYSLSIQPANLGNKFVKEKHLYFSLIFLMALKDIKI